MASLDWETPSTVQNGVYKETEVSELPVGSHLKVIE